MLFCVLPLPSRAAGAAPSVDLGVGLGSGATGYTVENLHQNGAAEESLKAVVKWRQDALNDTSVKWNGKTMKQYLADNDISESDYLNPKWSNALERIAIQRAIEAWDYNDGHTRPNGETCWTAQYGSYRSSAEILAWGSRSFAAAMDQWATEKSDWGNQSPGVVTGHYTTLIDPSYKAYGFGASSADYYGTAYAGEATSASDWDATPTNIQGKYTVEVNLSSAELAQGIADNVPDTLRVGESFAPVVKAKAYSQRLTMRGTWSSSDDKVLSVQSDGSILAKTGGKATLTFTVTATYDDKSTAEVPVTWNKVPNDWNSDRKAHTVKITGKVAWSNGDTTDETITWQSSTKDQYSKREGNTYDLTGAIAGKTVTATWP